MLLQEEMIARVRYLCQEDENVLAALKYGSFTKGEGDTYSDIEFYIYLKDDMHQTFEPTKWLAQIAPVAIYFVNEFGTGVAIFENLIRGEFHFERAADMVKMATWGKGFPAAENMLITDRTGELFSHLEQISQPQNPQETEETIRWHWHSFVNWVLIGKNMLARGEWARALEPLMFVQRYILWFARMMEGKGIYNHTPAKKLEQILSKETYANYVNCTASLKDGELENAYDFAWVWGKEMVRSLARKYGFSLEESLVEQLDSYFAKLSGGQ